MSPRAAARWPWRRWALVLAWMIGGAAVAAAAGPPPVEAFFAQPRVAGVTLSPDGRRIAMSLHTGGRAAIALYDVTARRVSVLVQDTDWDLVQPTWVSATRLAYKSWDHRSTLPDNRAGAWFAIDVDGGRAQRLWDSVAQSAAASRGPWRPLHPIGPGDAQRQELLVTLADRAPPGAADRFPGSDVYALDTLSGKRRLLTLDNPGQVQRWFVDRQHQVRAAWGMRTDVASGMAYYQTWWRDRGEGTWTLLAEHRMDAPGVFAAGIDADGSLLVTARGAGDDTWGLYRWDMAARRPGALLLRHARADISAEDLLADAQGRLVGVDVPALKRERWFFDAAAERLQSDIDRALPGRRNRVQLRGEHALVISSADTDPGTIHLYTPSSGRLEPLLRYLPGLPVEALSAKRPMVYKARDGFEIPAYLTLPRGASARKLPLVLLPHGGPAERDGWGDWWEENEPYVQFLASRGYAVLQPQYRGSWGFGWKLHRAGWKQWAGTSLDDLIDGVDHLVAQGIVDGARVCTMGKSAGGYSAIYALIKAPERWRCGISWAGTTEMSLFFSEASASYAGSAWLTTMAPWTHVRPDETELMAAASVVRNAARIRVPVLLAYGGADFVVPLTHGTKLRDALAGSGQPHEWMLFEREGHGWVLPENKITFARAVERFLAQHLRGPDGGAASAASGSSASPAVASASASAPAGTAAVPAATPAASVAAPGASR